MIIRQAKRSDIQQMAEVQVSSWNTTYRGLFPDDIIDSRTVESRSKNMSTHWKGFEGDEGTRIVLVAETEEKEIVGFSAGGDIFVKGLPYDGECYAIYIIKEYQGKGIGALLMKKLAEFLLSINYISMIIWVLEKNPACKFYEKIGGVVKERKIDKYGEEEFYLVGYVWENVETVLKI